MINDFSKKIKFQVGQRVKIDIPEIKEDERDVTTGIIVAIEVSVPESVEFRKIRYKVKLDNNGSYIKKQFRRYFNYLRNSFYIDEKNLLGI